MEVVCDHKNDSHEHYSDRQCRLDLECKQNRREWLLIKYPSVYSTSMAFTSELRWMVATGAVVADVLSSLAQRLDRQTLHHLVPVPLDPYARSHSETRTETL